MTNSTNFLFITGMARSGTTLLDRMLDFHEETSVFSQPLPYLYRFTKQQFFEEIGHLEKYYVLNNLFKESYYSRRDLLNFLDDFKINKSDLKKILLEMQGWSGQQTEITDIDGYINDFKASSLAETYKSVIAKLNQKQNIKLLGSKERLAEEFVPYFLKNGFKVILIIRDPRDVYTSLNYGKGTNYGGVFRPTLFHLRNWRKSIAIANTFLNEPNFLAIRYEDLLTERKISLQKITDFLNLKPFNNIDFNNGLKTSNGKIWEGNSSTHKLKGIDSKNLNKYKSYLDTKTIEYIEFICAPEMDSWDYKREFKNNNFNISDIKDFKEPYNINVENLDPQMSINKHNIVDELKRREILLGGYNNRRDIQSYFYSEKNFDILKKNVEYL